MKHRIRDLKVRRSLLRGLGSALAGAAAFLGLSAAEPQVAHAQEIQLTGPLAGAPAVRRLRLYREGRAELAVGWAPTLLDEYQRTHMVAARLQYNVFDWLGVGVFGGFTAASLSTDLTEQIDARAPRNSRTAVNIDQSRRTSFEDQTGKIKWMAVPQLTFSPFRGKLAIFQKIFVDTDLYLHGGAAFVNVEERAECGGASNPCTAPAAFATATRVAVAPSFGLGLTLYMNDFLNLNLEYRAFPFAWNRGGFDSRGAPPDASFPDLKVDSEDRTFKFNQMVFVGLGFHLPTKPKVSD